jgi:hypothetical protein
MQYLYNLFLGLDQAINTLLGGHPDETLSSRLGRSIDLERYFWVFPLRKVIDTLFWFDTEDHMGHCEKSIMPLEQENFRTVADYEIWSWSLDNPEKG